MTLGAGAGAPTEPKLGRAAALASHPVALAAVIAAAGAAAWLAAKPHTADMAAQAFRAGVFERQGFATWNGQWYGGHHLTPYSVLSPMLGGLLGVWWAGALAAVLAATALGSLSVTVSPDRRTAGVVSLLFAVGALAALACGRTTYLLGVAVGAFAFDRQLRGGRAFEWAIPSLLTPLASPVAGAFLALCSAARLNRSGLVAAALAVAPVIALDFAFPGGGSQPFSTLAFCLTVVACAVGLAVTRRGPRGLRVGIALYLAAVVAAFVLSTPVGANVTRLGQLAAAPLLALVLLPQGRKAMLLGLLVPALAWQWWAPVVDLSRAFGDRAASAGFHRPLAREVERRERASADPSRLEVVWTRGRWEAAAVTPRVPLARGWERQLDSRFDSAVNGPEVSATSYRKWLDELSVRWVAIADAPVEPSARGEADLVAGGLPWLKEVWRSGGWTLYEVEGAKPLSRSDAIEVDSLGPDSVRFEARRPTGPGGATLNVRWSRHWRLEGIEGCVRPQLDPATGEPGRNAMTTVVARSTGEGRLVMDAWGGGPHCPG